MNVISRLFLLIQQASIQMHRDVGEIFDYEGGFGGLKMIAETIVRFHNKGIASLLLTPDGLYNILTIPSGQYKYGFQLDNKLDKISDKEHYLLVMQCEKYLHLQNYLIIKIDEEGTVLEIYLIAKSRRTPSYVTSLDLDVEDRKADLIVTLLRICLAELDSFNINANAESLTVS